jgi:nicotinamidase-related amidase
MRRILVVVDMQKDFVDGALGTKEAVAIVPAVVEKIKSYDAGDVFFTKDTHQKDYMSTQEGSNLPVEHCIEGTPGWELDKDVAEVLRGSKVVNKPTFGSTDLARMIGDIASGEEIEIELIGLCTDICVVSNALLLKAFMPEVKISVDSACCAGVTPEKHEAALETMRSCQINVV